MITVQFYKYGLRNRRLIIQEKVDLNIVANQLKVTKIQSVISFFIIWLNTANGTYVKWNFKPQISSIFHFDRVSDSRMAHVLGVN